MIHLHHNNAADLLLTMAEDNTATDGGLPYSSLMCRRLQSFPEPDLEVVVGPNKRVYKYHALILASHSDFVDLMLSSPAAVKARENWRVEFPDVSEELWEKAISYLGPRQKEPDEQDLLDLLSFYDKYQFHAGKQLCDEVMYTHIDIIDDMGSYGYFSDEAIQNVRQMALMSFELKLPKSCKVAVKFAAHRLGNLHLESEEELLQLLPLVENDSKVLKKLVWSVRGRHSKGMNMKEMLEVVKEPNFFSNCDAIRKRVEECDRWISNTDTGRIDIIHAFFTGPSSSPAAGTFKVQDGSEYIRRAPHNGGALRKEWIKERHRFDVSENTVKIESMDFFGSVWEVFMLESETNEVGDDHQEDSEQAKRIVLWRWDCGHSSLFPPQHGWEKVSDEESVCGFFLSY